MAEPQDASRARRIPVFVNANAGSAEDVRSALSGAGALEMKLVPPAELKRAIREAVDSGHSRVCVAGGDGSIATAASVLRDGQVELAILPGGTLNHFAKDLALPLDVHEAASIATGPHTSAIDVGLVNDQLFLNTSSVGAYVTFVQWRERLERRVGYWLASIVAGVRILFRLRTFVVQVEVDGQQRFYRTPLVFIGVGERELKLPTLGARVGDGQRGLHVIVLRSRSGARTVATALAAMARGIEAVSRTPELDSFLVDRCTVRAPFRTIAVDGELVRMRGELRYEIARDAVRVVVPAPAPAR